MQNYSRDGGSINLVEVGHDFIGEGFCQAILRTDRFSRHRSTAPCATRVGLRSQTSQFPLSTHCGQPLRRAFSHDDGPSAECEQASIMDCSCRPVLADPGGSGFGLTKRSIVGRGGPFGRKWPEFMIIAALAYGVQLLWLLSPRRATNLSGNYLWLVVFWVFAMMEMIPGD